MARNSKSSSNRGQSQSSSQSRSNRSRSGAMTPQEAGHLGGIAPHTCRGFECQKSNNRRSR